MMRAAWDVEMLKMRRSRVVTVTTVILLGAPCALAAGFVAAANRPGVDAISVKARMLLVGDGWDAYLSAVAQVFATAGLLGMGIAVAWCFGREYADRTVVSLYAAATTLTQVATAKLLLLTLWSLGVAGALGPVALLVGLATGLGLPDHSAVLGLGRVVVLAACTGLLALGVAPIASIGRGYLAAFAGLLGLVVAAQVAVIAGVGAWFPYSAPGLWAVASGVPSAPGVSVGQLAVVPVSAIAFGAVTLTWWRHAELP